MIEVCELCKCYGDKILFENMSFKIESGEFVCFSGESGRGKTTMLNMLGMIEPPSSGRILIDGMEILSRREKMDFFRYKVGFVFQNFALVEEKTVEQNMQFIKKAYRTDISIEESLEMVGMKEKLHAKIYTLSGGEQQRVALARLFIKKCDLVLADEPTGSLDAANVDKVWRILRMLHDSGKTIVLVSHDKDIQKKSDRLIKL